MPLLSCPDCNREISDQAPACPYCGRPKTEPVAPPMPAKPTWGPAKSGCVALAGVLAFVFLLSLCSTTDRPGSRSNSGMSMSDSNQITCSSSMNVMRETLAGIDRIAAGMAKASHHTIMEQKCFQLPAGDRAGFQALSDRVASSMKECSRAAPVDMGPVLINGMMCASVEGAVSISTAYDERSGEAVRIAATLDR